MPTFTYEFEELDLGENLFVDGQADITYRVERDEPDVGFIGGLEYYISDIEIDDKDGNRLYLKDHSLLNDNVEKALFKARDNDIRDNCRKDFDKYGLESD